jgi:hypothetical protein
MQETREQYRGFQICVMPFKDQRQDGLWDYEYRIERIDGPAASVGPKRAQTVGGCLSGEVARNAGIEVARIEVDNLLAMEQAGAASPERSVPPGRPS